MVSISPAIPRRCRCPAGPTGDPPMAASPAAILRWCGAGRSTSSARRMRSATCSTARKRCMTPTWRPPSARRSTTGSQPNGWRATAACAPRSWCRCRRLIWRSRKSNAAPATTGLSRCWCWRKARRCWGGGITGRSIRLPRSTNCRSRSMPAASIARHRARSAGRPIATNIIWPRRRRFRPRCLA